MASNAARRLNDSRANDNAFAAAIAVQLANTDYNKWTPKDVPAAVHVLRARCRELAGALVEGRPVANEAVDLASLAMAIARIGGTR